MATERVYHPETCEPFDVAPSKASSLVLDKGWSRTPWTRVEVPAVADVVEDLMVEDDADEVDTDPAAELEVEPEAQPARGRGRGRGRRDAEEDAAPSWRS